MAAAGAPPQLLQLLDVATTMEGGREPVVLLFCRRSPDDVSVCLRVSGCYPNFYVPRPTVASNPKGPIDEFLGGPFSKVRSVELCRRTAVHYYQKEQEYWRIYLNDFRVTATLRKAIDQGRLNGGFARQTFNSNLDFSKQAIIELGLTMYGWFSLVNVPVLNQVATRMSSCKTEYVVSQVDMIRPFPAELEEPQSTVHVMSFDIEMAGRRGIFPDPDVDPIIQISSLVRTHAGTVIAFCLFTWKATTVQKPMPVYGDCTSEIVILLNEAKMLERWIQELTTTDTDIFTGWGIDTFDLYMIMKRCEKLGVSVVGLGRLLNNRVEIKQSEFKSKAYGKRAQCKISGLAGRLIVDMLKGVVMREHKLRSYNLKDSCRHFLALRNCFDLYDCDATIDTVFTVYGVSTKDPYRLEFLNGDTCQVIYSQEGVLDGKACVTPRLAFDATSYYRLRVSRDVKPNLLFVETSESKFYVCNRSCDINKVDLHYTKISEHWNSDSDELRGELAYYCLVDSSCPVDIMEKLRTIDNLIAMGQVTGCNMTTLTQGGQGVKTEMLLATFCYRNNFIVDFLPKRILAVLGRNEYYDDKIWLCQEDAFGEAVDDDGEPAAKEKKKDDDDDDGPMYVGAIVLDVVRGLHKYIGVLDFASLYPSIMQSNNLCFSTVVRNLIEFLKQGFTMNDVFKSPLEGDVYFVKPSVRRGILPQVLESLLTARRQTRKLMGTLPSGHKKAALDARQLALKVTANSVYGFAGNQFSSMINMDVGATVTAIGRENLLETKRIVEEAFPGSFCVAGDSVLPDTPILCLRMSGLIDFVQIDELAGDNGTWSETLDGKEIAQVDADIAAVWSDTGFTPIRHIVRHDCRKRIMRVVTDSGQVDVTEDHSLICEDGLTEISPNQLHCGDCILHADFPAATRCTYLTPDIAYSWGCFQQYTWVPIQVLNGSMEIKVAYLRGLYYTHGTRYSCCSKVDRAGLYYLEQITGHRKRGTNKVKDITLLPVRTGYVYDLETANHHFSAGIGNIIVHNTDSVMVKWGPECTSIVQSGLNCIKAAKLVNAALRAKDPETKMSLEFEKVFREMLIIEKKRYFGSYFGDKPGRFVEGAEEPDEPDMIYERGIETIRRDVCPLVSETMAAVNFFMIRGGEGGIEKAKRIVRQVVCDLYMCRTPIEKITMCKEYKGEYKNKQPHAEVVAKLKKRDPTTAPQLGDRVPYVIMPHDSKVQKIFDAAEDPRYCIEVLGSYPSQEWIIESQLKKPISRAMEPVIGEAAVHELFHGEHTRRRKRIIPKTGGLASFLLRGADADAARIVAPPPPQPLLAAPPAAKPAPKKAKPAPPPQASIMSFFKR